LVSLSKLALLPYFLARPLFGAKSGSLAWGLRKEMPHQREDAVAAALGKKLYAIAGFEPGPEGPVISSRAERYDPASDSWEELPPLPSPRHHAVAAGANGKLYVFGGHGDLRGAVTLNDTYAFDPRTGAWERKADMPAPRAAGGVAMLGGKIYLIGGRTGGSIFEGNFRPPLASVDVYDPAADTWERGPPMSVARDHLGVEVLGGKIYAVGGRSFTMLNPLSAVEVYDPATGRWEMAPRLPIPLSGDIFAARGRLIMPGGVLGVLPISFTLEYAPGRGWKLLGLASGGGYAHGIEEMGGVGYVLCESPNGGYVYSDLVRTIVIKKQ